MATQLEKDVASNAGVIPIWPWLGDDKKPKDGLPPNIYANMLLQAKRANGEEGGIIRCDHDGCEHDTKSMFWRSADTANNIVPEGWTDFGGASEFTYCPSCRASDIEDIGLDEASETWRVDINLKHGSTGSSGASDKPLRRRTVSLPRPKPPTIKNTTRRTNMKLKEQARKLFKNHPEHLEATLQEIDKEERKKRADAAEERKKSKKTTEFKGPEGKFSLGKKTKKKGGRRKKRTRRRRKSRRRKRTRKRRKSRHRKRTRKRR